MVLAFTKNKEVVFVRQYKHGVREITVELPAGMRKEKSPEEAAHCELKEETGIVTKDLIFLGKLFLAPSKDGTITNVFVASDVEITQEQNLDDNEDIEVFLIPIKEIDEKIAKGEIMSADTIAALALAKLKLPKLFI
jgi:8-oxo-dGTP pyrophosphatase MutT (NUDIX family)